MLAYDGREHRRGAFPLQECKSATVQQKLLQARTAFFYMYILLLVILVVASTRDRCMLDVIYILLSYPISRYYYGYVGGASLYIRARRRQDGWSRAWRAAVPRWLRFAVMSTLVRAGVVGALREPPMGEYARPPSAAPPQPKARVRFS